MKSKRVNIENRIMYYLLISNQLFHLFVIEKDTTKKNQKVFTNYCNLTNY